MKIVINDTVRRKKEAVQDHRRKKFLFQIAQISFVVFMTPFIRLKIFSSPLSQPRIFGGLSKCLPAPYPALLMTGPLASFLIVLFYQNTLLFRHVILNRAIAMGRPPPGKLNAYLCNLVYVYFYRLFCPDF